jgi:hypothetical protein
MEHHRSHTLPLQMYLGKPFHKATSLKSHAHHDQEQRVALSYCLVCIFDSKMKEALVYDSSEAYRFPSRLDADADQGILGILCSSIGAINNNGLPEASIGSLLRMLSKRTMLHQGYISKNFQSQLDLDSIYFHASSHFLVLQHILRYGIAILCANKQTSKHLPILPV